MLTTAIAYSVKLLSYKTTSAWAPALSIVCNSCVSLRNWTNDILLSNPPSYQCAMLIYSSQRTWYQTYIPHCPPLMILSKVKWILGFQIQWDYSYCLISIINFVCLSFLPRYSVMICLIGLFELDFHFFIYLLISLYLIYYLFWPIFLPMYWIIGLYIVMLIKLYGYDL